MPSPRSHYAGVLLISRGNACILQLRETKAGIVNAGRITTFGGTVEPGETALECALRELREELNLSLVEEQLSVLMETTIAVAGEIRYCTIFISQNIKPQDLCLREGEAIAILSLDECMGNPLLSPLCQQVIEVYASRQRRR